LSREHTARRQVAHELKKKNCWNRGKNEKGLGTAGKTDLGQNSQLSQGTHTGRRMGQNARPTQAKGNRTTWCRKYGRGGSNASFVLKNAGFGQVSTKKNGREATNAGDYSPDFERYGKGGVDKRPGPQKKNNEREANGTFHLGGQGWSIVQKKACIT